MSKSQKENDHFTRAGAEFLAKRIESFWMQRGYSKIQAEAFPIAGIPFHFGVQSNIGSNGFPPGTPLPQFKSALV